MDIKSFIQFDDFDTLRNLWNDELMDAFPITHALFQRNVEHCPNLCKEASFVMIEKGNPIGFIVSKIWKESYSIFSYDTIGWISLLFVSNSHRGMGIGSKLLEEAQRCFVELGKSVIHLGKDPNNFFPGIPRILDHSVGWFEKRGYDIGKNTHDLIRESSSGKESPENDLETIKMEYLSPKTFDSTFAFMEKNFPGRWSFELSDYWERGGTGREYLIMRDGETVIGFCRINDWQSTIINYNMTWAALFEKLGGIGPLGINAEHRGRNLGFLMVSNAVCELIKRGADHIIIDWTSLISFYSKFGFRIWREYAYASKKI